MTFSSFGIVGFGHFGQFMATSLKDVGDVVAYDIDASQLTTSANGVRAGTIADVATADVAVIAVPYGSLVDVLIGLRTHLLPTTVVMDVVSTKARSTQLLDEVLGDHPELLATHPLFGPPSMDRMGPDDRMVITERRGGRALEFEGFLQQRFGLQITAIDPDEHDRQMAYMQALPFFIARALVDLKIPQLTEPHGLELPSFEKLMAIAAIEQHHTDEMFHTSQRSNPYAESARRELLDALKSLHDELAKADLNDPLPLPGQLELPEVR